jgi:flagellar motor protein MotB
MSFADFVSCLLACFVLLFSMVSLDKEKFQQIIGSIPAAPISTCRRRSRWNAA